MELQRAKGRYFQTLNGRASDNHDDDMMRKHIRSKGTAQAGTAVIARDSLNLNGNVDISA